MLPYALTESVSNSIRNLARLCNGLVNKLSCNDIDRFFSNKEIREMVSFIYFNHLSHDHIKGDKKCEPPSQGETKDNSKPNVNCPSDHDDKLPVFKDCKFTEEEVEEVARKTCEEKGLSYYGSFDAPIIKPENTPKMISEDLNYLKLYDRVSDALINSDSIPKQVDRLTKTELLDIMRFFHNHVKEHLPSKVLGENKLDPRKPSVRLIEHEQHSDSFEIKLVRELGFKLSGFFNKETGQHLIPWVRIDGHEESPNVSTLQYFPTLGALLEEIRAGRFD